MKIPKYFETWFNTFGIMDDYPGDTESWNKMKRVAWRSYRKGVKDTKQANNPVEPTTNKQSRCICIAHQNPVWSCPVHGDL